MSAAQMMLEEYRNKRREILNATFSVADAGPTEVIAAPGAGERIVVLDGLSVASVAGTQNWLAGATSLNGAALVTAAGQAIRLGLWPLPANTALNLTTATATCSGWVTYAIVED